MRYIIVTLILISIGCGCEKKDDSEELFNKAEGFVKLNMYKEALEIYIELKNRDYRTELVNEKIKMVSERLADEKLKGELKKLVNDIVADIGPSTQRSTGSTGIGQPFKVSRCDESYNERISQIKKDMKPYLDELSEIDKRLEKISSEYKVVNIDGGYSFAVAADTPVERQKEIAEGPARDFGTFMARKNELVAKINKYNQEINAIVEEAKKAGQPSDCIKR